MLNYIRNLLATHVGSYLTKVLEVLRKILYHTVYVKECACIIMLNTWYDNHTIMLLEGFTLSV